MNHDHMTRSPVQALDGDARRRAYSLAYWAFYDGRTPAWMGGHGSFPRYRPAFNPMLFVWRRYRHLYNAGNIVGASLILRETAS